MGDRTALILGASGLVGGHLLDFLLDSPAYRRVTSLGRRPLAAHPKLEQVVTDLGDLERHADRFAADDVYCCLGTTIKKAGSRPAFRRVDHDYPLAAASLARAAGAGAFLVVTAIGADPHSAFFYNRVKGELERDLIALGLPSLHIFRPSLLLGKRGESRPGEEAATLLSKIFSPFFSGPLAKYRPVEARAVAYAMYAAATRPPAGPVCVHESAAIAALYGGEPNGR